MMNKLVLFLTIFALVACKSDPKGEKTSQKKSPTETYVCPMHCEGDKTYDGPGSCPVCKMDLRPVGDPNAKETIENEEISETSIFNLDSKWKTQNGKTIELKDLRGQTLVMVMIYTSCDAACPRLVADMRNIENKLPKSILPKVDFVFVSIDPETDTPKKLKQFAKDNVMDDARHIFLQGSMDGVREFANVLSVKYNKISPIDFSHSNIISVFNPAGELVHQQEGLGLDYDNTVRAIKNTVK